MADELELLAPAGNLEILKAVIHAGADAVYFGGSQFGARAYAKNFDKEEVLEAIDFGHIHGKKIILAVNTLLKEKELEEQLYEYLLPYYERGLDAVIVQDLGVMQFIRRNFKDLPIHTSTQMTVTNTSGAELLVKAGAERIVMARELSFEEIAKIHQVVPVEIESFVHGALCYCYSGQCLLSSMLGGRSGNRGRCAQPCRLPYEVYDAAHQKINKKNALYPLSLKDLCTIDYIPQLAKSGVYSFKIEGRMKQAEYAAGVVSVYRKYMDRYLSYGEEGYFVSEQDQKKLFDLGNRSGFTDGYYQRWNGPEMVTFEKPGHEKGNETLRKEVARDYILSECKEPVQGIFQARLDRPIELTVQYQNHTVTVTGASAVMAQKQPVTKEKIYEKLNKTGNTPFVFESLEINMEENLFLSIGAVNELRRQALEQLEEQCLLSYQRTDAGEKVLLPEIKDLSQEKKLKITASAENEEQIEPLLESEIISTVYIDSTVFSREQTVAKMKETMQAAKQEGKELYYILPAVFRECTSAFYASILPELQTDGYLVKSYDALAFLLKQKISADKIRIDHSLYTWSNESRQAFFSYRIQGDTVPLELNGKEIKRRDNRQSEMLLYGYLPLMTSAQCINRNLTKCDKTKKVYYLKDRYGISFPVKNHCNECYNVIYNSKPLYLFSVLQELKGCGMMRFRLSFTIENKKETEKVLKVCQMAMEKNPKNVQTADMSERTYGHYKRGVE